MNGVSSTEARHLAALNSRALGRLMTHGEQPDLEALAGREYRGTNLGAVAGVLRIRKFIKGFFYAPDGALNGYNVHVRQNEPDAPWIAVPENGTPRRFGFYRVTRVNPAARDNTYPRALLLDYGRGGNGRLNILSTLRDYLVRVAPGSDRLLLGRAFMALGPLRVPVGYFVLEHDRAVNSTVSV